MLHDLATNPATGHHIAVKLAKHFVADDPPPTLVAKLERSFSSSGGQLGEVATTLIDAPESWVAQQRKFKTPYEFLISGYRAAALTPGPEIVPVLTQLGQQPFSAPSPKGWSEDATDWASADGVVKRMGWAEAFAARNVSLTGRGHGRAQKTRSAGQLTRRRRRPPSARAESRAEAFSILLMSPEFQRR